MTQEYTKKKNRDKEVKFTAINTLGPTAWISACIKKALEPINSTDNYFIKQGCNVFERNCEYRWGTL